MDSYEVTELVTREISGYRYPALARGGKKPLLGHPWSSDRVARELEALRSALVPPVRMSVASDSSVSEHWVVAQATDGTVVFYDEVRGEFGLAQQGADGRLQDINARGDVVGVFMAR